MRADTRLPPYLPYPRFLLQADLTQTAKLLYALLLDRATLSQANGWLDESGRIYLVFPIEKIAAALDRSSMTVKTALSELEDAGLIERRRSGFSKPNRIYVKLPPDGQKTFQVTDRKPSSIGTENYPTDGQKIVPMMERKLSPNNLNFLKNGRSNIGASKLILCISVNASHNSVVFIYVFKRFFYCVLNEISVCFSGQIRLPRIKN